MTVIVSVFTPEGFVIAADGRRISADSNETVTDEAQKIYFADHPQFCFAYGWAHATTFDTACGGRFDFDNQTQEIVTDLSKTRFQSADHFIRCLITAIYKNLVLCVGGNRLFPQDHVSGLLAKAIFVGYFNGKPTEGQVGFRHEHGYLLRPEYGFFAEGPHDLAILSGSEIIADRMDGVDPKTLVEAANRTEVYVRQCISGCGTVSDCVGFGGHVHMASVTPDGHKWIIPPVGNNSCRMT